LGKLPEPESTQLFSDEPPCFPAYRDARDEAWSIPRRCRGEENLRKPEREDSVQGALDWRNRSSNSVSGDSAAVALLSARQRTLHRHRLAIAHDLHTNFVAGLLATERVREVVQVTDRLTIK